MYFINAHCSFIKVLAERLKIKIEKTDKKLVNKTINKTLSKYLNWIFSFVSTLILYRKK